MRLYISLAIIFTFTAGYLANGLVSDFSKFYQEQPFSAGALKGSGYAPSDHVKESQIHVYSDRIVLDIPKASWSSFTPTGSMIPFFDENANGIEITPKSTDDIKIGDVVSYKSDYADGIIIHRVVQEGIDDKGWYVVVKGDNNPTSDPGKIRFSQIYGVLVAIVY